MRTKAIVKNHAKQIFANGCSRGVRVRKAIVGCRRGVLTVAVAALMLVSGCQKSSDKVDCIVSWHLYKAQKHASIEEVEQVFHDTFTGFWQDGPSYNTVRVTDIDCSEVRSLTLKLAQMADEKVVEELVPDLGCDVTVRVFIDFDNSYEEEVWGKTYRRTQ